MGERERTYIMFVGKTEGRGSLGKNKVGVGIILKCTLNEMKRCGLAYSGSG
jgi:hypothetical protein